MASSGSYVLQWVDWQGHEVALSQGRAASGFRWSLESCKGVGNSEGGTGLTLAEIPGGKQWQIECGFRQPQRKQEGSL